MKKLNIYKSALAILSMSSIALFSGCSEALESTPDQASKQPTYCYHLTIYFEDQPITFKECEGYNVNISRHGYDSEIDYTIIKDSAMIIDGSTINYNSYIVNHEVADEIIDNKSVQKVK